VKERDVGRLDIDRRRFLTGSGFAAGGMMLGGCAHGDHEDPYALTKPRVPGSAGWAKGEERYIATACAQCSAGCGIRVRVVEGRAVKIEGNLACPVNMGGVGPRGLSGPQVLYDPDRVRQPLRRKGGRGAANPTFEPVTWDAAYDELGARLKSLRDASNAHKLAIVCGRERGMTLELLRRFAQSFGTPNVFDGLSGGDGPVATACELMQGVREIPAFDWTRTRYILSLGSGLLEASCQSVYFARAQGQMRRGRNGVRAKIVHVGHARSRTAMNADEWLPARPGTHAAFALALAHVLVRDGLYDKDFVGEHGFGFEPWKGEDGREHAGFRQVLQEYPPERAATVCQVTPAVIERIAREMAEARPSFAIANSEELLASNGLSTAMAVHALNALLGSIDRPGGVLVQRAAPLAAWPELELDELATASLAHARLGSDDETRFPFGSPPLDALPAALTSGQADGLEALFFYYSNPLYARSQQREWRAALAKVPLIVSFTPFLDETAQETADWILPDDTYLERFEDAAPAPSVGYAIFGIRQPTVERLHDTRATGDVVIQLAQRIGSPVQEALPWKDFKDAVKQRIVGLFQAKRGTIVEEKGSAFLKRLYEEGYWSEPDYVFEQWPEVLATPSGRFEFFSQRLLAAVAERAARAQMPVEGWLAHVGLPVDLDRVCMPAHEEIAWHGDEQRFPLLLLPYRPNTYAEGSGANLPWLQELHIHAGRPTWTTEAEMHPSTASAANVRSGERVAIASANGNELEAVARLSTDVLPGIVRIAQGGGHTAFGRFATSWGDNVMKLVSATGVHPLAGACSLCDTRVQLRRLA
jgi:anaerobic selenocysteine-containing dehydrogenase